MIENIEAGVLHRRFAALLSDLGSDGDAEATKFARHLHLFVRMLQAESANAQTSATAIAGERSARFRELLERIFADPVKTTPLFFATRGLWFLNYLDEQPFARPAVEIGCGSGHTSALLFRVPFDVGVDVAPEFASFVRERDMHREYVVASAEHLPFPDGSIATLVLNNTLYHVAERDRLFAELFRVLRPGGSLLFDDITPAIVDPANHPTFAFIGNVGSPELERLIWRRRLESEVSGRAVDARALLRAEGYPAYLAPFGFRDVLAREFCSPRLTRVAYATHDVEYLFGHHDPEPTPWYRAWVETVLSPAILADGPISAREGGSFVFVKARR